MLFCETGQVEHEYIQGFVFPIHLQLADQLALDDEEIS
jgi:hypothetical protein